MKPVCDEPCFSYGDVVGKMTIYRQHPATRWNVELCIESDHLRPSMDAGVGATHSAQRRGAGVDRNDSTLQCFFDRSHASLPREAVKVGPGVGDPKKNRRHASAQAKLTKR